MKNVRLITSERSEYQSTIIHTGKDYTLNEMRFLLSFLESVEITKKSFACFNVSVDGAEDSNYLENKVKMAVSDDCMRISINNKSQYSDLARDIVCRALKQQGLWD
ncbi:hypothetical protein [Salinicola lusitanus]|uniref:hypothetical protein n=1 Tax=Salinicola lusitanus TaxID=1949085 RepID=UPI001300ADDD|nr:hypothetical protein [Salinicola lusitanus]